MKKILILLIAVSIISIGCTNQDQQTQQGNHKNTLTYEIGSNDWSSLTALSANDNVIEAYQFAVDHPEVLDYIPCYCGCYEADGHISNTHCFVESVEDNVANLDNMGLG